MDTQTYNEDWLRTRTWDLWRDRKLISTLPDLLWSLDVSFAPEEKQRAELEHFVSLPVWESAPESLKSEVSAYLNGFTPEELSKAASIANAVLRVAGIKKFRFQPVIKGGPGSGRHAENGAEPTKPHLRYIASATADFFDKGGKIRSFDPQNLTDEDKQVFRREATTAKQHYEALRQRNFEIQSEQRPRGADGRVSEIPKEQYAKLSKELDAVRQEMDSWNLYNRALVTCLKGKNTDGMKLYVAYDQGGKPTGLLLSKENPTNNSEEALTSIGDMKHAGTALIYLQAKDAAERGVGVRSEQWGHSKGYHELIGRTLTPVKGGTTSSKWTKAQVREIASLDIPNAQLVAKGGPGSGRHPESFIAPNQNAAYDWLHQHVGTVIGSATRGSITGEEEQAVKKYAGEAYGDINEELRSHDQGITDADDSGMLYSGPLATLIQSAIDKSVVDAPVTVFRGLGFNIFDEEGLEPGDEFRDPGFTSTSLMSGAADQFTSDLGMMAKIQVPEGSHAVSITAGDEIELLLGANARFTFHGYDDSGNALLTYVGTDPDHSGTVEKAKRRRKRARKYVWQRGDLSVVRKGSVKKGGPGSGRHKQPVESFTTVGSSLPKEAASFITANAQKFFDAGGKVVRLSGLSKEEQQELEEQAHMAYNALWEQWEQGKATYRAYEGADFTMNVVESSPYISRAFAAQGKDGCFDLAAIGPDGTLVGAIGASVVRPEPSDPETVSVSFMGSLQTMPGIGAALQYSLCRVAKGFPLTSSYTQDSKDYHEKIGRIFPSENTDYSQWTEQQVRDVAKLPVKASPEQLP